MIDTEGNIVRSMIRTISAYAYTGKIGAEIARRILGGDFKPGFQTPAAVYGSEVGCSNGTAHITDL